MANAEQGQFVPIRYAYSRKVSFDIPFPEFEDTEHLDKRVGVNLRLINLLCDLGGVNHLGISGESGEQSRGGVPTVVGFNQNGEAYAGKNTTRVEIPIYSVFSKPNHDRDQKIPHFARWIDADVRLNMSEISAKISQDNRWKKGIRTSEAWSEQIDKILKSAILKTGLKHLIIDMDHAYFNFAISIDTASVLIGLSSIAQSTSETLQLNLITSNMFDLLSRLVIVNIAASAFVRIIYDLKTGGLDRSRISMIFGPELDRALVLWVMARTRTLAKAIPSKE